MIASVIALAQETPTAYADIVVGSLPPDEGICITASAGSPRATDLERANAFTVYAVLNAKSADQKKAADALGDIHEKLTHRHDYPNTANYQITNIGTVAAPSLIGREANSQWLYGSSIRIDFYFRNVPEPPAQDSGSETDETTENETEV